MPCKIGFNNEIYLREQTKRILERVGRFDKLYLEFGGKIFDDYHASRVLPGFDPNGKISLLMQLRDQAEIILCISAKAIEQNRINADYGITYDQDLMRLIDNLRKCGLTVSSVLITQYERQRQADAFRKKLQMRGERVYTHTLTKGYPSDVDVIVSDEGYGANPYIETTRPIVVVTAPGSGNGKLATCLSQLYHEQKRNVRAGYAKYETFPVWNLPLQHPVNIAYEAATADLKDVNMIDPFHLSAYGETAVNYNRDIEVFPVLRTILHRITGQDVYKSPTDMGVNMIGQAITDDAVVCEASRQEVIRRWYGERVSYVQGRGDTATIKRIEFLLSSLGLRPQEDRKCVKPALDKAEESGRSVIALELKDGRVVTGKGSELMNNTASVALNSIKALAGISQDIPLMSLNVLEPIIDLKKNMLGSRYPVLNLEEVLLALSISAPTNPVAELALKFLPNLRDCDAHGSDIITKDDAATFLKLGIRFTCEPEFPTKSLYFH
jgi:uncharacterized protein (UPF0371 family)